MRIAFDGTTLQPQRTGVGYYTEHLLRHVAAEAAHTRDEVVVLSNHPIDIDAALPAGVRVVTSGSRMPRIAWTQLLAPRTLRDLAPDVAHFTNGMIPMVSPVPTVVTIHDMSLRLYPQYHPVRRVLLNRPLVDLAARRADAIITVSESAKRDITDLYGLDPSRVHVVHEAAAPAFHAVVDPGELARVRRRYHLADRIILYVGTIEPRKNLPRLIDAFAARTKSGELNHQLVCVGPYGWLSNGLGEHIERSGVARSIVFTGYVPFADLPALYSAAEMFVFPSLHEGFGLPVIEAMACGVPVITGEMSAMPEIAGSAVEQVDAHDTDALGAAIVGLANDPERRRHLSAVGRARAAAFSWQRAARETLAVYRQAVRARSHASTPEPLVPHVRTVERAPAVDVLFGQAYYLRFDPKLWSARQPYPPLGTLYAAAVAREHGYRVALFDAMLAASEAEWAAALDRHRPRFAVIYEDNFNYLTKMCLLRMRQAALTMIEAARSRGITTIVAGSDASDHPDPYLAQGVDVVIAGEGEVTLRAVLDVLSGRIDEPLDTVRGICLPTPSGAVMRTASRELIRDLDALPLPAWDLVDVARYRRIWMRRHGYFSMNLTTTRGCPYHCNWCAKPIYGQRYTIRSPERVVAEMAWLKEQFHPDHLWIVDDIFGLKPGWIERFAELAAERDAVIPFKCLLRADQVTPAVAAALRAARCQTAWIGAESGSQRILDAMEKGIRVEEIATATRLLREAGIAVGFFLQFGYPSETRADVDMTLAMVRDCQPDDIGVSISYPLPGTRFYDRVKDQLGRKRNWIDSGDLAVMYRATYVPEFYRALHALVHNEFQMRRLARELKRVAARRPAFGSRPLRNAALLASRAARQPFLQRRVDRLEQLSPPQMTVAPLTVLTRQAAAMPSEPWR